MTDPVTPTYWKETFDERNDCVDLVECPEEDAHFISSRMSNGKHRILLDIDRKVEMEEGGLNLNAVYWPDQHRLASEWEMLGYVLVHTGICRIMRTGTRDTFHFGYPIRFKGKAALYPSVSGLPDHFHFVADPPNDHLLEWKRLQSILERFEAVGVIDRKWLDLCRAKEMAILLKPGISKEIGYAARREQHERWARRSSLIYIESPYGSPYGSSRSPYGGGSREF